MNTGRFSRLKATIARELTAEQCVELALLLERVAAERRAEVELAKRARELETRRRCPHCGSDDILGHGRDRLGRARWRCRPGPGRGCGRTFGVLAGTPFARMRLPGKWTAYAQLMRQHLSVEAIVARLDIARQTAWR